MYSLRPVQFAAWRNNVIVFSTSHVVGHDLYVEYSEKSLATLNGRMLFLPIKHWQVHKNIYDYITLIHEIIDKMLFEFEIIKKKKNKKLLEDFITVYSGVAFTAYSVYRSIHYSYISIATVDNSTAYAIRNSSGRHQIAKYTIPESKEPIKPVLIRELGLKLSSRPTSSTFMQLFPIMDVNTSEATYPLDAEGIVFCENVVTEEIDAVRTIFALEKDPWDFIKAMLKLGYCRKYLIFEYPSFSASQAVTYPVEINKEVEKFMKPIRIYEDYYQAIYGQVKEAEK